MIPSNIFCYSSLVAGVHTLSTLLLMHTSLAGEKMHSVYQEFVLLINLSSGWGYSAFKQQEPGVSITTSVLKWAVVIQCVYA